MVDRRADYVQVKIGPVQAVPEHERDLGFDPRLEQDRHVDRLAQGARSRAAASSRSAACR